MARCSGRDGIEMFIFYDISNRKLRLCATRAKCLNLC